MLAARKPNGGSVPRLAWMASILPINASRWARCSIWACLWAEMPDVFDCARAIAALPLTDMPLSTCPDGVSGALASWVAAVGRLLVLPYVFEAPDPLCLAARASAAAARASLESLSCPVPPSFCPPPRSVVAVFFVHELPMIYVHQARDPAQRRS